MVEAHRPAADLECRGVGPVADGDRLGNGLQAVLDHADVLEDAVDHPHDPAGHVDDADHQACGQGDGADADQRLAPQPQGKAGGGDHQQAVQRGNDHVHAGDHPRGQLGLLGLLADRLAGVLLLVVGMGEQLERGDVGVAVDDAPHQLGAGVGGNHRALLHPWHEVVQRTDIAGDPHQQRQHQPPVGLSEQHQRTDGVDQHVPQRVHRLHRRIAQGVAGLHDALGDAPGEVALEEVQALLEHVGVVLPADQAGHARADGLVHQQVMQAEKHRPQQQHHHQHPDQLAAVLAEEIGVGRALGQVDNPAQVAEQRHFDQRGDQADDQQGEEARPHLAQVVEIEGPDLAGRRLAGRLAENVDQLLETTVQHG